MPLREGRFAPSAARRAFRTDLAEAIARGLLQQLPEVARACQASAILVYLDSLEGLELPVGEDLAQKLIYVARGEEELPEPPPGRIVHVPEVPLTRMGQMKVAVFTALSRDLLKAGDVILFLGGVAGSGTIDTVIITEAGREFEAYSLPERGDELPADVAPEVMERVIDLATELGREGREGKPVGTIFVVGDTPHVLPLSRQLILNPFRGYPQEHRNVLDPDLEETIKELSTIDGAFVIRGDGVVETCGTYLTVASEAESELPAGLGTRHHAAAAISAVTEAIAVTVSESTGTVMIFRHGRSITEIEKLASSTPGKPRFVA